MRWSEQLRPQRMRRVAIVAPVPQLEPALTRIAAAGVVELDLPAPDSGGPPAPGEHPDEGGPDEAGRDEGGRDDGTPEDGTPEDGTPDDGTPGRRGARGARETELAREVELARVSAAAVRSGEVAGLVGWTPEAELPALAATLGELGTAVVPVRAPAGVQPPTQLPGGRAGRSFDLLVETYTTVPYRDVDPTLVAGLAYVAMFGMMFGDVGHGALLVLGAVLVRTGRLPGRWGRSAGLRRSWAFLAGGGAASIVFGALYGEFFGPTRVLPVLWLDPLEDPVPMLLAAVGVGAVLIGGAYALGTANRVREGGWVYALYARTGIAGSLLFVALGTLVAGMTRSAHWLVASSVVLAVCGLGLAFVGLLVESGGGVAGVIQAVVELFDLVVRLGSNVVSFARLAAFGLTHAALGAVVWQGTTALWEPGVGLLAAGLVFVVGNVLTFALEALVAGIQALRLEYYELFSRVFAEEGRPFRPWRLPDPPGGTDGKRGAP